MIKLILLSALFGFSMNAFAQSGKSKKTSKPDVTISRQSITTNIVGSFQRYDNKFMYLKVRGAKNLVKVPNKYSLNSPANYGKGLNLKLEVPLKELLASNKK